MIGPNFFFNDLTRAHPFPNNLMYHFDLNVTFFPLPTDFRRMIGEKLYFHSCLRVSFQEKNKVHNVPATTTISEKQANAATMEVLIGCVDNSCEIQ